MKRLVRERGRLLLGSALLLAAVIILGVAYASIADEIMVAIQLPYILGGGVSALLCAGVGLLLIRSQDETRNRDRLVALESAHEAMGDRFEALGVRVEYVTQLLEALLQEDGAAVPPRPAPREVRI